MFHDYEATVTVGADGRVELLLPEAVPGARVHVAVRAADDSEWATRLAAGTLRAPSLPDEAFRRESIYADDVR